MGGITQTIFSIIGSLLYPIFSVFFYVIDVIQNIFYSFAGLGMVTFGGRNFGIGGTTVDNSGGGEDTQNGIIYYLFRTETAKNILISMAILGVFLLIIFTVLAFIKNMYAAKQKRWQEIISSSIKGLINFLFLPVCCLLGVIAGNVLLQALNEATASSSDITIGRQLFVTSAYNGNVFRDQWNENADDVANLQALYKETFGRDLNLQNVNDPSVYAEYLDEIFKSKNGPEISSWWSVNGWYHLWNINYLMIAAGGVFLLFALIKISFGALKRLFMLVLLFVISPAVCSLYPLDDGSAVGKWRGKFIEQFFSVYGAVIGMNLFFDLVPLINSIQFSGISDVLGLVPLLVTIAGLYMVNDFINLITSLIPGAGNAYNEGSSLAGNVKRRVLQGTKAAGKGIRKVEGAFARAVGAGSARKEYFKNREDVKAAADQAEADFKTRNAASSLPLAEGSAEYKAAVEKARKDATKNKISALKKDKDVKKEAGSGFFGSMGGSIFQGVKDIGNTIMDKSGFGKLAKRGEGAISTGYQTGKEETEKKQKTNRAARKATETLASIEALPSTIESMPEVTDAEKMAKAQAIRKHNVDQMEKISKTVGGENGEDIWGVLKKNDAFKAAYAASGYGGDLSKMTAADFMTRHQGQSRQFQAMEAQVQAVGAHEELGKEIQTAIGDIIRRSGAHGLDLNEIFKQVFDEGKTLDVDKIPKKNTRQRKAYEEINSYMASRSDDIDTSKAKIQSATIQAQNVTESNRENGDSQFTATMDKYLGYLQQTLNSIKDNKAIREMDSHLTEQFKQLIQKQTEMIKKIKETSASEKDAIVDAVKKAAQKASEGKK